MAPRQQPAKEGTDKDGGGAGMHVKKRVLVVQPVRQLDQDD
jgi:hypothetical protein